MFDFRVSGGATVVSLLQEDDGVTVRAAGAPIVKFRNDGKIITYDHFAGRVDMTFVKAK